MNTNLQAALEVFFDSPTTPLHIRKIARIINLSPAAVSNYLKELESRDLIKKHREEITTEYKANKESEEFKWRKRINNLKNLYESGLIDYLSKKCALDASIILFGSYSRGEDVENSDIDLAIVGTCNADIHKYEKILKREINILEINPARVSDELKSNIRNGIVIWGYSNL